MSSINKGTIGTSQKNRWRFTVEKINHDADQTKKRMNHNEEFEISSTGYGLESVTKETDEEAKTENSDSSCGGL